MTDADWRDLFELLAEEERRCQDTRAAIHDGLLESSPIADGSEREEVWAAGLQNDRIRRCAELRQKLLKIRLTEPAPVPVALGADGEMRLALYGPLPSRVEQSHGREVVDRREVERLADEYREASTIQGTQVARGRLRMGIQRLIDSVEVRVTEDTLAANFRANVP